MRSRNIYLFIKGAFKKALWLASLSMFIHSFSSQAGQWYQPNITPYPLEPYAWRELEGLPNDSIFDLVPDNNNHLWLGGHHAILHYDGKKITKYVPENIATDRQFIYSLTMRHDGELFAMSDNQMLHFKDSRWQLYGPQISPIPYEHWLRKRITAGKDNFWQKAGSQLLRINESSFQFIPLHSGSIEHFIVDKNNYIWVLFQATGDVKRYAVNQNQLVELNHWPNVIESNIQGKLTYLDNHELWLTTTDSKQAPLMLKANNLNNHLHTNVDWQAIQYPTTEGYNNQAVTLSQHNNILVFSSTQLHLKQGDKWHATPLASQGINREVLSLKKAPNGDLWMLELGKAIRRYTASPRQETVNDLIFGCEDKYNEFFIHQNGSIIQHNFLANTWLKHQKNDGIIATPVNLLCTKNGYIVAYGSDNNTAAISIIDGKLLSSKPSQPKLWKKILLPELKHNIGQSSVIEADNNTLYLGRNDEHPSPEGVLIKLSNLDDEIIKQNIALTSGRVATLTQRNSQQLVMSNQVLNQLTLSPATAQPLATLSLPDNLVYAWIEGLASDSNETLWLATWHYGVLSLTNGIWRQYALNEGVRGKNVSSIVALENDNILALTNKGVDRFDGVVWQPLDIFNVEAIREGSNIVEANQNRLWVNQASRNWMFRYKNTKPATAFTQVQNQHFKTIKYQPSKLAPFVEVKLASVIEPYQNSALLSWRGYDQWFETPSDSLKYAYRVNNGDWSIFSSDTSHYFTNLSPNDYLVEVIARDADGNITELPAAIAFTISAPFWQQTWFYIAISLVFIAMLITLLVLIAQRLKHTSNINQARMHFLTNISHELRNPLSLIISPLEEFFNKNNPDKKHHNHGLTLALRNAKRLKQLIDQLLDYRRLQAGNVQLDNQPGELISVLKLIIHDLTFIANKKQQSISLLTVLPHYYCRFDHDVIRKIVENLITNAIKYSGEQAKIYVVIEKNKQQGIKISVEDTGIGIPLDEQKQIFNPFYSQKTHRFDNHNSFGIGLALVQNLVQLNEGHIDVISPPPAKKHGAYFYVVFPKMVEIDAVLKNKSHNEPHNEETTSADVSHQAENLDELQSTNVLTNTLTNEKNQNSAPTNTSAESENSAIHLLIVDDNVELANYLKTELTSEFHCHVEYDGEQALTYAKKAIPDIIVSDYKMPNMDGLALTKALKEQSETSHIPLLLHTAMISDEHQLKGLAFGAVDYLLKPVSLPILKKRIHNLMANRSHYANYITQNITNSSNVPVAEQPDNNILIDNSLNISEQEKEFLDKVHQQMLANFHLSSFNAEQLANDIFMSRSAFYRKFKALTNITPAEYIKSHRLHTAKQLLANGYTVSEIISKVGYSDPSSFNRAYNSFFQKNPSE